VDKTIAGEPQLSEVGFRIDYFHAAPDELLRGAGAAGLT
jgi:hypothetical protein